MSCAKPSNRTTLTSLTGSSLRKTLLWLNQHLTHFKRRMLSLASSGSSWQSSSRRNQSLISWLCFCGSRLFCVCIGPSLSKWPLHRNLLRSVRYRHLFSVRQPAWISFFSSKASLRWLSALSSCKRAQARSHTQPQ